MGSASVPSEVRLFQGVASRCFKRGLCGHYPSEVIFKSVDRTVKYNYTLGTKTLNLSVHISLHISLGDTNTVWLHKISDCIEVVLFDERTEYCPIIIEDFP